MNDQTETETPRRARPRVGDTLELEAGDLAYGGACVARTGNYVVFVHGAVPGDKLKAVVTKSKRNYGEARMVELLQSSPERIEPVADHPGAPWQVMRYERQLEAKQQQVDDSLKRIGKLEGYVLEEIIPADQQWRYRNKLEYSFGNDENGELTLGFHAPGRWDVIEHLEDCMLASEAGNAVRNRALAWLKEEGLSAYDRETGEGLLRNLVVRESFTNNQLQVRLVTSSGAFRTDSFAEAVDTDSLLWTVLDTPGETTAGGKTTVLAGKPFIQEHICDLDFKISSQAFFQTNTTMTEKLYAVVGEYAQLTGKECVYDLFSGIGTIGLTLARQARELWGIEQVESAVADAIANAELNGLYNTNFYAGDVRLALPELREKTDKPDLCVVDPPRSGLSKKSVRRLLETEAQRIVYVSCNPTTLAANAQQMVEAGYKLVRVRPVDMFPQTPHIECVALFERTPKRVVT